jgi:hypothetical protein
LFQPFAANDGVIVPDKSWHFLWIPTIFLDTNVAMLFFFGAPHPAAAFAGQAWRLLRHRGLVVLRWGIYCLCPSKPQ